MQWLINIILEIVLPPGMIMIWHGTEETIPSGWHRCDGTNGTVNLTNYAVVGAGGIYAQDSTYGTFNHDHDFTGDGHSHTIGSGTDIAAGTDYEALTSLSVGSGTTDSESSLSPSRGLYFIQKL